MDRLSALVTNLLELSRLRADELPVLCSRVGLDDVVAGAWTTCRASAASSWM